MTTVRANLWLLAQIRARPEQDHGDNGVVKFVRSVPKAGNAINER